MESPSYVLVVALGPVQDFIATARRCRDLWFGSWLLSELSKTAAKSIAKSIENQPGSTLIFPPPGTDFGNINEAISNKLLAVVANPEEAAKDAEAAARGRLAEIAEDTLKRFGADVDKVAALAQIVDLLEWNWGAARIENNDFLTARNRAERIVASRKGLRDFGPVGLWAGAAPKSSLDGNREGVVRNPPKTEEDSYKKYRARKGETMCGVALLKRHGQRENEDSRVASTSHIAAQGLLNRWNELHGSQHELPIARNAVAGFIAQLSSLDLPPNELNAMLDGAPNRDKIFGLHDGHLLFPGRLEEFFDKPEKAERNTDTDKPWRARKALIDVLKQLDPNKKAVEPHPYYALLLADGDGMGVAISDAAASGQERLIELSEKLAEFARGVRQTVEAHRGTLIYAGGDDVLALLPVHNALDVTRQLSVEFKQLFAGFPGLSKAPTLSAGLLVYHHTEPLSGALELVRGAEKAAKSVEGKDAIAVMISKRSGSDETVAGKWSTSVAARDGLDGRLQFFIAWAKAGEVAAGLAYEWRDLGLRVPLQKIEGDEATKAARKAHNEIVHKIWLSEAKRILERKKKRGGEKDVAPWLLEGTKELLKRAKANAKSEERWLETLAQELIAAKEIASAQSLALYDNQEILKEMETAHSETQTEAPNGSTS